METPLTCRRRTLFQFLLSVHLAFLLPFSFRFAFLPFSTIELEKERRLRANALRAGGPHLLSAALWGIPASAAAPDGSGTPQRSVPALPATPHPPRALRLLLCVLRRGENG